MKKEIFIVEWVKTVQSTTIYQKLISIQIPKNIQNVFNYIAIHFWNNYKSDAVIVNICDPEKELSEYR